ncbi:LOW QUALITY PROTEIN: potassium channel subfamily U member 1 [Alca torda]
MLFDVIHLQFVAADDKLRFWLELNSLVDFFMIPPVSFLLLKEELAYFLLQDKGNVCTEIFFLGESIPSLELEAVFKCCSAYTVFFYDSALNSEDLRVGMESANARLILANVHSPQPYTEGTSNIIRCVEGLRQVFLPNIPYWEGDSIICFAKPTLGFVAQSCLVPGSSTLLTNLFIGKEDTELCPSLTERKYLKDKILLKGKDNKVMTFQPSNDFADMTFIEVSQLCFVKLNLVLLGTELKFGSKGESAVLINPLAQIKLHRNSGLFLLVVPWQKSKGFWMYQSKTELNYKHFGSFLHSPYTVVKVVHGVLDSSKLIVREVRSCKDEAALNLQDHICCIFGDATPLTELQDFIYHDLKDIVFLGSLEYLQREWKFIQNFPKLWLFSGRLSCGDLTAVNVQDCAACAILSFNTTASSSPSLGGTESILTTLNIWSSDTLQMCTPIGVYSYVVATKFWIKVPRVETEYAVFRARALGNQSQPCYKRIPITTELILTGFAAGTGLSSNAQFINLAPSGNSEIPDQDHLSTTGDPAGAIFSGSFLNSLLSMEDCFGDMYCRALDLFGILCFRLYCLMEEPNLYTNRFVVARPDSDLKMLPTDQFCVVPFNIATTDNVGCGMEVSYQARKQGWQFEFG